MSLNNFVELCGTNANAAGWHDDYPQREDYLDAAAYEQAVTLWVTAKAGLIAAEAHEAIEELRNGYDFEEVYYNGDKPEGFGVELADVVIRTLDLAWVTGLNMEDLVTRKLAHNKMRGLRHGGKKL